MRRIVLLLVCVNILAADGPVITLLESMMRVDGAAKPSTGELRIKAEKLTDKTCAATATVKDWSGESAPGLSIEFTAQPEAIEAQGVSYFLLKATIKELPPNTTVQRYLRFTCGKDAALLSYSVTNRRRNVPTLAITAPGKPYQLLYQRLVTLSLKATGDGELTNLSIVISTLMDESTGRRLGKECLHLCSKFDDKGTCQPPVPLVTDAAKSVYLQIGPEFDENGQFKGNVWITADQLAEAASVELTVNATSYLAWFLAAVFLLLGIALSWFVSVYARARVTRTEALLPVAELAETLNTLIGQLEKAEGATKVSTEPLVSRLLEIRKQLSESNLDAKSLLPAKLPNPFRPANSLDALKQFLTPLAARVSQFAVLTSGVQRAAARFQPGIPPPVEVAIRSAIDTLCKADPKSDSETADLVKTELQKIELAAQPAPAAIGLESRSAGRGSLPGVDVPLPTRAQLLIRVAHIVGAVWFLWAALTVITGFGALVLTNPSFGVPTDYLKCFLWALGVQMAGQQLQQLGPGSISTALGVSVPKAQ